MKVEAENSREISMKIHVFAVSVVLALFLGGFQVGACNHVRPAKCARNSIRFRS